MGPEILPLVLIPPTLFFLSVYLGRIPRRWRVAAFALGSLALGSAWLLSGSRFLHTTLFCLAVIAMSVLHFVASTGYSVWLERKSDSSRATSTPEPARRH